MSDDVERAIAKWSLYVIAHICAVGSLIMAVLNSPTGPVMLLEMAGIMFLSLAIAAECEGYNRMVWLRLGVLENE